jgi:hypothetical protein
MDPLAEGSAFGVSYGFTGELKDPLEKALVIGTFSKGIGLFCVLPGRERRLSLHIVADIRPAALYEVGRHSSPLGLVMWSGQVFRQDGKGGMKESKKRSKGIFFSAVRGGCDKDQMTVRIFSQAPDKPMALVPSPSLVFRMSAGMSLVNNDKLRTGSEKFIPPSVGLYVVHRDDHVRIHLEERLAYRTNPLKPVDGTWKNELGLDVKFRLQFFLPLLCKMGWAKHGQTIHLPPVQELPGHQAGLYGFSDSHVIGNEEANRVELQCHEERHKLVRSRLDTYPGKGAERPGAGPQTKAHGISQ